MHVTCEATCPAPGAPPPSRLRTWSKLFLTSSVPPILVTANLSGSRGGGVQKIPITGILRCFLAPGHAQFSFQERPFVGAEPAADESIVGAFRGGTTPKLWSGPRVYREGSRASGPHPGHSPVRAARVFLGEVGTLPPTKPEGYQPLSLSAAVAMERPQAPANPPAKPE